MFLCCNRIADNKFCKRRTLFCRGRRKVVYGSRLYWFIFEYLDCNKLMPKITYLATLNSPFYGILEIRAMINSPNISLTQAIPKKQGRENRKFISLIPMRSNLFQTPRVEELGFDFNTFFKINNWILYAPSRLPKTSIIKQAFIWSTYYFIIYRQIQEKHQIQDSSDRSENTMWAWSFLATYQYYILVSMSISYVILNLNLRNLYVIEHDTRNCIILAAQG